MDLLRSNDLSQEETQMVLNSFFERLSATANMLENLLLWVQNQSRMPQTQKESVELSKIFNQVLLLGHIMAKDKEITIHHEANEKLKVYVDPQHLFIIFQNVFSNAIKFTPKNGNIWVSYESFPEKIVLKIKDSGVGMPESKIKQLFSVMGKNISTYGTDNEKGIGIGLILFKKYASENDSDIFVESSSEGTTFSLIFKPIA